MKAFIVEPLQNGRSGFRQKAGRFPFSKNAALCRDAATTSRACCSGLNRFLLPALIAGLNLILAGRVTAQTFTTLHSFSGGDGANPRTGLILLGNTLYGTAEVGGSSGRGALFAFNPDGTGFTNLYSFTATSGSGGDYGTNSDGVGPSSDLITNASGNTLYGTAFGGGSSGYGTVFAVSINGTGFTNLHSFTATSGSNGYYGTNGDGAIPNGLILSGNTLYGTAADGGSSGYGTLFAVNTDGSGFTNLHNFTAVVYDLTLQKSTNSDGANPLTGLILSSNTLYGTASQGGSSGYGTVFAVNTDGTGFTNLHNFTIAGGANPYAGLILAGNTLYGTAQRGGSGGGGGGTVFALGTDGTGFTNLYSFTGFDDGGHPKGRLLLSAGTLYGTTFDGGILRLGAVFAVNTDGTGFTSLHSFTGDGQNPYAGLILSGNTLYGTTYRGGASGNGTVFSLSFAPQLTITPSGTNVILSWPVSYAGFSYTGYFLQDTANLQSPTGWSVADPFPPVIVDGQYRVTRPMLGPQRSYRLAR